MVHLFMSVSGPEIQAWAFQKYGWHKIKIFVKNWKCLSKLKKLDQI